MKANLLLILGAVLYCDATSLNQLSARLNSDEEVRAVENATVRRVAAKLDSATAHGDDADHSAAENAIKGVLHTHDDF